MISSTSIRKSLESLLRNKMMEVHNENKKNMMRSVKGEMDGKVGILISMRLFTVCWVRLTSDDGSLGCLLMLGGRAGAGGSSAPSRY